MQIFPFCNRSISNSNGWNEVAELMLNKNEYVRIYIYNFYRMDFCPGHFFCPSNHIKINNSIRLCDSDPDITYAREQIEYNLLVKKLFFLRPSFCIVSIISASIFTLFFPFMRSLRCLKGRRGAFLKEWKSGKK